MTERGKPGIEQAPVPFVPGASCGGCGLLFYPWRGICPDCLSGDVRAERLPGGGRVYSFSTVYRGVSSEFRSRVPYILALIDSDDGVRILSNLVDCDEGEIELGARVAAVYREGPTGEQLLQFALADRDD